MADRISEDEIAMLMRAFNKHDTDGDGVSMAANGGLTDAEGALSDVNSIYECGGGEAGDLDDTSLSSRASSRFCIFKTRWSRN